MRAALRPRSLRAGSLGPRSLRAGSLGLALLLATGMAQAQPGPEPPPWTPMKPTPVELERSGRRKTIAGGLMVGAGAALTLIGIGLIYDDYSRGHACDAPLGCPANSRELYGGLLTMAAGIGVALGSIPLFIVGGYQVRRARSPSGQLTLGPMGGGGAAVRLRLTF